MSIYSALSTNVPIIMYSAVHQMKKGTSEKGYVKTLQDMHDSIRLESTKVADQWKVYLAETSASSMQTTRGTLSQFLTLPLDSDLRDVQRILDDQIAQLMKQVLPVSTHGVVVSTEGKFVQEKEPNASLQALLTRGNSYFKKLKFNLIRPEQPIFESDFILEGGLNLDIIEHIVRDRMGVYAETHGRHTQQADTFIFAAHNLVHLHGSLSVENSKYEAVLHFSKGRVQYEQYRKSLIELLERCNKLTNVAHYSLWQRKLGLGAGAEFNIRIRGSERKLIRDFVLALLKREEEVVPFGPVIRNANMIVKELIY
jgi:hypothetical protein